MVETTQNKFTILANYVSCDNCVRCLRVGAFVCKYTLAHKYCLDEELETLTLFVYKQNVVSIATA